MPQSCDYVKCLYCPKEVRKDKIVTHLYTHKTFVIKSMTVKQREWVLESKKPIMFYKKPNTKDYLFACCLHCKKGAIQCSQRSSVTDVFNTHHTQCIESFSVYCSLFDSKLPEDNLLNNSKWVEIPYQKHTKIVRSVKDAVESTEPAVSMLSIQTACVTPGLSADTEARIISMWKEDRTADEEVESDEETTEGKLLSILDSITRLRKQIKNNAAITARTVQTYKTTAEEWEERYHQLNDKCDSIAAPLKEEINRLQNVIENQKKHYG